MSNKINKAQKSFGINGNKRHMNTPFIRLFNRLKANALKKKIPVLLTYDEFVTFTKDDRCHYCYNDIVWIPHGQKGIKYNLDRSDNSKPYSLSNCVTCCSKCNYGKSDSFSYEEWFGMTKYFRDLKCPIK